MFSWMIKRNQPHELYSSVLKTLTMFHTKTFLFDYLSMLAKTTCFCSNLLWNIMLLQVLISDLISNLASVSFLIPGKHFVCSHMPYVYLATPMQRLILKLYNACEYLN